MTTAIMISAPIKRYNIQSKLKIANGARNKNLNERKGNNAILIAKCRSDDKVSRSTIRSTLDRECSTCFSSRHSTTTTSSSDNNNQAAAGRRKKRGRLIKGLRGITFPY
uniref:Uncharacterized protein n=1 Tax=Trypanosoma vivax (strain Y486) TaxID=1055687 RepID=G0U6F1_TRYVY|nr:hypothetical protein, unlikely [Trypanosoma vivax Y486]